MTGITRAERRRDSGALSPRSLPRFLSVLPHLTAPLSTSSLVHPAPLLCELLHGFIKTSKVASLSAAAISTGA